MHIESSDMHWHIESSDMHIESCHRHMHIDSLLLPSCHDGDESFLFDESFLLPSMIYE